MKKSREIVGGKQTNKWSANESQLWTCPSWQPPSPSQDNLVYEEATQQIATLPTVVTQPMPGFDQTSRPQPGLGGVGTALMSLQQIYQRVS